MEKWQADVTANCISAFFRSSSIRRFLAVTKGLVPFNDLIFFVFLFSRDLQWLKLLVEFLRSTTYKIHSTFRQDLFWSKHTDLPKQAYISYFCRSSSSMPFLST